MQLSPTAEQTPIRSVTDERLDFAHSTPLRKSYIVASSQRCGSTYLCWLLWQTGLLGAPSEALNSATNDSRLMSARFAAASASDYIVKLVAHRTSANGVFGMKAHFHQFESYLKKFPELLDVLSPVTFIHIRRGDKVAQGVSMARALQSSQWSSRQQAGPKPPPRYDPELIAKCMEEVELQDANWLRWFETENITPFQVTYEDLTADADGTVRGIVELLGVQNDKPSQVDVPPAEKQSDDTNQEWIARFRQETSVTGERREAGVEHGGPDAQDIAEPSAALGHFFDRYDRLIQSLPDGRNSASGFVGVIRLRRRYDAIIAGNRELFQNAHVLDIASAHGFWSLAALDAGAAHVVGVEASKTLVRIAEKNFLESLVDRNSYRFHQSGILAALENFEREQFDVILCRGFFERCHPPQFFYHLSRLRPRHVILDTRIIPGHGPMARFAIATGGHRAIVSTPNHEMIAFLCEREFQWRLIDWRAIGVADGIGITDYARDTRRTYVLDRLRKLDEQAVS